ncbi:MAG: hypothetical protein WC755_09820 [Candidatus Woesearchaeota archaeon]|jgi:hypothetical protein
MIWNKKYSVLKKVIGIFGFIVLEIGHYLNNLTLILIGVISSIIAISMLFKK